jgi:hypothetical protein
MAGKGQPKTGGRSKGTTNKVTADVKAMVLDALDQAGGVGYLLTQAQSNPNAFLTLVGKVLPMTVAGDPANPLQTITRIELVAGDSRQD